jgi:hypothetical protein
VVVVAIGVDEYMYVEAVVEVAAMSELSGTSIHNARMVEERTI